MKVARLAISLSLVATALGAVACSDSPTTPGDSDALLMAQRFSEIGDSLDGAGMTAYARPYSYVGRLIRLAGGVTPITLTVDGRDAQYYAVAEQNETWYWRCRYVAFAAADTFSSPPSPGTPPIEPYPGPSSCELASSVQNAFYAWLPNAEWRLFRIVADTGLARIDRWWIDSASVGVDAPKADPSVRPDGSVGTGGVALGYDELPPLFYSPMLWAELMDSHGRFWWANEGSQTSRVVARSGEDVCAPPGYDERALALWAPMHCTRATFSYEHRLRFDPAPVMLMSSRAGAEDTVRSVMPLQRVRGVIIRSDTLGWAPPGGPPPGPGPVPPDSGLVDPVPPQPPPSHPPLDVRAFGVVDSTRAGVAFLRMTVTNASADTVRLTFPSAQQFDFTVLDPATGESVFSWSATRSFAAVVTTRTLAPRASTSYSAEWEYGARRGEYTLEARLTSSDHPARARATLHLR